MPFNGLVPDNFKVSHGVPDEVPEIVDAKYEYLVIAMEEGTVADRSPICRIPRRGGYVLLEPVLPDSVRKEIFRVVRYWQCRRPTDNELRVYDARGFVVWHLI